MCFTEGKQTRRHYEEAAKPPRPVAPVYKADRWEKPRKAPRAPPNPQERRKTEAHVKQALRDAGKVESNRHKKRFATSNSSADKIRESALAKAKESRARVPHPHPSPPVATGPVVNDQFDSSAYPAPLTIRKKSPQPPPKQQHSVKRTELGNTVPAFNNAAKEVDQSHIHPALRTTARPEHHIHPALRSATSSSSKPTDQSHIHPALRTTAWPSAEIHPALRNLPPTPSPSPPRRVSDLSQSSLERDIYSYLGNPLNYADSPRESDVSPVNVKQKIPSASSTRRRR